MKSKKIEILKKLKALSDRGIGGEKENAQKMLDDLLVKYKISIEEVEGEEIKTFYFKAKDDIEIRLLSQIASRVRYDIEKYVITSTFAKMHRLAGRFCIECTIIEYVEIEQMFFLYKRLYAEEREIFYTAFLSANDLLARNPSNLIYVKDLSDKEIQHLSRAMKMSENIKKETIYKQIK